MSEVYIDIYTKSQTESCPQISVHSKYLGITKLYFTIYSCYFKYA